MADVALQPHSATAPRSVRKRSSLKMALKRNDDNEAALATCMMRGWVEVLEENAPVGDLTAEGALPSGPLYSRTETQYRLTEGGWAALNRAHSWTLVSVVLAIFAIGTTVALSHH